MRGRPLPAICVVALSLTFGAFEKSALAVPNENAAVNASSDKDENEDQDRNYSPEGKFEPPMAEKDERDPRDSDPTYIRDRFLAMSNADKEACNIQQATW